MSFKVDLYLETGNHAVRMKEGKCGWVMEFRLKDGRIVTREGVVKEENTTGNRLHILAMTEALKVLKPGCEVRVHTYSVYLESLIMEWIEIWSLFGWRKSRNGEKVKNEDILPLLLMEKINHKFSFEVRARHIYTEWIKSELEKE